MNPPDYSSASSIPEFRVFISSTFADMQAEREHLIKKIFPEIRQLCRERGVLFTEVDLRWGITEGEAKQGGIVSTCLNEIALRRPYIIALVGNRYGWQPQTKDLRDRQALLQRYPWLEAAIIEQRSLVELESLEAATNEPEMQNRVRFYFKEKSPQERDVDRVNAAEVEGFRLRVQRSGIPLREGYRTPEQLGRWVREDLLSLLDTIAPADYHDSWIERECRGHEAFGISRRHAYVENPQTLERLNRHVQSTRAERKNGSTPLIVIGESGSGKSALLAWWSNRFRREHPGAFVIVHHIGATPLSGDPIGLMRRVAWEIRERYGISEEPSADPETLTKEFSSWLARTQNEPLILVIDALNQLADHTGQVPLAWLPEHFPSSVRIILSTVECSIADRLRSRDWPILQITPLGKEERHRVVREFLAHYGKEVESRQLRRIVDDHKTANPLYLRAGLEELRLSGEHGKLEEQINYYLEATDLNELFQRILERLEGDFGAELTQSVMRLLWASRNGLSENELLGMLTCSRLRLTRLLHALEYHLMRRDGLLTFYHDHLRQGVEQRYLRLLRSRHAAHKKIATWFREQPISPRRAEEEPWGWMRAEQKQELWATLRNPSLFLLMHRREPYEAIRFWRHIEDADTLQKTCRAMIYDPLFKSLKQLERFELLDSLSHLFESWNDLQEAEEYAERALNTAVNPTQRTTALLRLCEIAREQGEYNRAEILARESLRGAEPEKGERTDLFVKGLNNLIMLLIDQSRFDEASRLSEQLDKEAMQRAIPTPVLFETLNNIGLLFHYRGKHAAAESLYLRALDLCRQTRLDANNEGISMHNIGSLYSTINEFARAEGFLQKAAELRINLFGEQHPETLTSLAALAHLHFQLNRIKEAEKGFRTVLEHRRRILGDYHPLTGQCALNLGSILRRTGKQQESEEMLRLAYRSFKKSCGLHHILTAAARNNLGNLLLDTDRLEEATEHLFGAYEFYKCQLGKRHPQTLASITSIGRLLVLRNKRKAAAQWLACGLQIAVKELGGEHPTVRAMQRYIP